MKYLLIPVIMSALVISCVSKSDSGLVQAQNDSLNRRKQDITHVIAGDWTIEYSNKIFVPEIPDSIAEELPYDEAERRRTAGSQVSN
jgi:hypothetical protein